MPTKVPTDKPLFVLVDSNALVHRAYHAYPPTLALPDGTQVNAVYGFTTLLLDVLNKFNPQYVICAFDSHKPTIRHSEYVGYKATRKKTDSELIDQFPITYDVVNAFNIPMYKIDGYEADDIIGTLVSRDNLNGDVTKLIVTGDHDLLQLVDDHTFVYMAGSSFSKSKVYGIEEVKERYGFGPEFMTDYKAMKGDPSDNIPGVAGIGDKGATTLINEYGHLEDIYKHIDEIKGRNQQKLIDDQEQAFLSKKLATIMIDTPLSFKLEDAKLTDYSSEEVIELFQKLRFRSLIKKIPASTRPPTDSGLQQSLFSVKDEESSTNFQEAETLKDLSKFVDQSDTEIAVSLFTDDQNCINQELLGLTLHSSGNTLYINKNKAEDFVEDLAALMSDKKKKKVFFGLKSSMHSLINAGVEIFENVEDVSLMSYLLLEGEGKNELKDLAFAEAGLMIKGEKELLGSGRNKLKQSEVSSGDLGAYLADNAHAVYEVYKKQNEKLNKDKNSKLRHLYEDVELPTAKILNTVERNGIKVDKKYLDDYKSELLGEIKKVTDEIYKDIGHEFNVSSPKQVGEVLFGELGLPGGKKGKSGAYSTNERVLRDLRDAHPVVNKILRYRELEKLRSTYTDALTSKIDPETGRIHAKFNQAVTSSGRLSSSDPNLQNIPVSSDDGMKIRKAFVAPKGSKLIALDISQQELRVIANLSGEDKLKKAFEDGTDIHKLTASGMFEIPVDKVSKKQREIGKTMNYSLLYGISAFGLADRLKVDREEAQVFIHKFWDAYPKIEKFFDDYLNKAKEDGYAETYFGRRRSAKNLSSKNFRIREAAKRELVNFPVQGTSADLMKMAMILVHKSLSEHNKLSPKILLQVHDELVIEVKDRGEEGISNFSDKMIKIMEGVTDFDVPLEVEAKVGDDWSEIK